MKKSRYFSAVTAVFLILFYISLLADGRRMVRNAIQSRHDVDNEIARQQQKYIENLNSLLSADSSGYARILAEYKRADSVSARNSLFLQLKAAGDSLGMSDNPLRRRSLDEMAGALNRISRLEQEYNKASDQYLSVCGSTAGRLAGCRD